MEFFFVLGHFFGNFVVGVQSETFYFPSSQPTQRHFRQSTVNDLALSLEMVSYRSACGTEEMWLMTEFKGNKRLQGWHLTVVC